MPSSDESARIAEGWAAADVFQSNGRVNHLPWDTTSPTAHGLFLRNLTGYRLDCALNRLHELQKYAQSAWFPGSRLSRRHCGVRRAVWGARITPHFRQQVIECSHHLGNHGSCVRDVLA